MLADEARRATDEAATASGRGVVARQAARSPARREPFTEGDAVNTTTMSGVGAS